MIPTRHVFRVAAALLAALIAGAGTLTLAAPRAHAATTTLCGSQTAATNDGQDIIQNNEWNSSASECITTDGGDDFTVANSSISNATNGAPGGYPSIYDGCHWGACSGGTIAHNPVQEAAGVTTSWSTTLGASGSDVYDVAYDNWFNSAPTTSGAPDCAELMVWLNHQGPIQPFGSDAATATIDGVSYNVWYGMQSWATISYVMTSPATSVSNLNLGDLAKDAVSRGYMPASCYLISVEAGFELWQGGHGLATNSFSVNSSGGGSSGPPPPPGGCSASYSLVNSWPGGFQAQVTVSNTGSGPLNGWTLGWTFPGDQKITSLWNGSYTQSGEQVTVTNASYNGTIAPGSSVTVGFTGTYTNSDASPSSVTCI